MDVFEDGGPLPEFEGEAERFGEMELGGFEAAFEKEAVAPHARVDDLGGTEWLERVREMVVREVADALRDALRGLRSGR